MRHKIIRVTTIPLSLKVLLKGQLGFMNQFFDIIAVANNEPDLEMVNLQEGVKIAGVSLTRQITPVRDLLGLIQMCVLFIKEKPLIVHSHTPKAGLIAMLAAWLTRVPIRMHTVAGIPWMVMSGPKFQLLKFLEKVTYFCSNAVYPNSYQLKMFIEESNLCNQRKLKLIGFGSSNGININHFTKTSELIEQGKNIRHQYNIKDDDIVFGFCGRIVTDKGINELVNAFEDVLAIHPNVKLLLIGKQEDALDPLYPVTQQKIKKYQQIIVTGFQKDVRPFFSATDIFVFPSYREGFPNVVLQACCLELPCIVSDINGCNEIIQHDVSGLIVPAKDVLALKNAMLNLLNNQSGRSLMASNAKSYVSSKFSQQFVWDCLHNEYLLKISTIAKA